MRIVNYKEKCSGRVTLISNVYVRVWVIKQLPQYSGKRVFQRRAKLTIFATNGKSNISLLW
jgi:hypothetical protein